MLSRRIIRAATAKVGNDREIAERLLAAAMREKSEPARSSEQKRLLDDSRAGK